MGRSYHHYDWDYYSESRPRKVTGGIKTRSERGAIGETWWSKRWLAVLESFGMGTRLARGRSYARQGQVLSVAVQAGSVTARVQGSLRTPYSIEIRLQPLSPSEWDDVIAVMAAQAVFAAKLLAGEMPTNIEEAFGAVKLSLFPSTEDDLQTSCSCPDWANPCKHIAAVYYILAERFDEDPFLLFTLRGRSKDEIIADLRSKRLQSLPSVEPAASQAAGPQELRLEDHLASFWQAGDALATFTVDPQEPEVDKAVLKRLGDAPFSIGRENVTHILERAYDLIREAAQHKMEVVQADAGGMNLD